MREMAERMLLTEERRSAAIVTLGCLDLESKLDKKMEKSSYPRMHSSMLVGTIVKVIQA